MKRYARWLAALLLIALGWNLALALGSYAVHLPVVMGAPIQPGTITLVETDTSFVSAARDDQSGRIFVSYVDRAHGNRLHLTELVGDALVEVPAPTVASAPAFSPPDSPKDADSAIIAFNGWVYWFTTSREINEAGQPFKLKLRRFQPGPVVPSPTPAKVPGPTNTPAGPSLP